jgi:mannose/fructose-specific phosphotransferase system component IIA
MMNTIITFILTHEQIAICLQKAIEKILGKQENLFPYTNQVDALPVLGEKIRKNIQEIQAKHIVCFVDLAGGSCWNLANIIAKQHKYVTIIAGVNLPMLISYYSNLNELPFDQLILKTIKDGSRGIIHVQGGQ